MKYLDYIFFPSAFCPLPSAFPQPRSPKVAKNHIMIQSILRLDAIDLRKYSHPILASTTLLNEISLSFLPNEFIVIAGVSGGGKSTLIDALNGQRKARGKVLIDGVDLYKNYHAFKNLIGYVPQDDIVHLDLTVWEAFMFAAQLRVPFLSISEQQQWVEAILQRLHLVERKNVPVKQLSGGQRKRVSIGVELISSPSLFFLDEATSGLDPGTELQIMSLLRSFFDQASTVVLITHATKNVAMAQAPTVGDRRSSSFPRQRWTTGIRGAAQVGIRLFWGTRF